MEKHEMIVLSTAHVSKETDDILQQVTNGTTNIEGLVVYNKGKYGWFIPIIKDELKNLENNECPADLYLCMRYALENGCDWIMFDNGVDTNETPELPVYDW